MAWTECQKDAMPFKEYGGIIDELKAAVIERYTAVRSVLQTYHSADIHSGTTSDYDSNMRKVVKFTDIVTAARCLFTSMYDFTERSNSTTVNISGHSIYYYFCSSPDLVDGEAVGLLTDTIAFTGGVGPWWSRQASDAIWTIDGQTYHAYGTMYKGIEKVMVDELIRRINHCYYLAVKDTLDHDTTFTVYNFYNGMGNMNFEYGENAFIA